MDNIFMLYANCIPVRGYTRTAICDLQRHGIHFIPNGLYQLLEDDRIIRVDKWYKALDKEDRISLEEYLEHLDRLELGFYCKESDIKRFAKLSQEWIFPGHVTNCIFDAETTLWYFDKVLIDQLDELCCDYIQLRFFGQVTFEHLRFVMLLIAESRIKAVEILAPKSKSGNFYNSVMEIVVDFPQIQSFFIHSDENSETIRIAENGMGQVLKSTATVTSEHHCGLVSPLYFATNITHFSETQRYNSCLHRKISVSSNGDIKNCPSMKESFGNIRNTTLQEAIKKTGFTRYWNITKNQVMICKDCEFRYVCTDCRAYLENPKDDYSKPLKCGYDPYTCTWEEWSTHPMKQKAIDHYGMRDQCH